MKTSWIEDDSDVIDVIESAKETWFEAHANDFLPSTDETTDGDVNESLGLPRSGALRPLSDEFADWSKEEIAQAVTRGLDKWIARAQFLTSDQRKYIELCANLASPKSPSAELDVDDEGRTAILEVVLPQSDNDENFPDEELRAEIEEYLGSGYEALLVEGNLDMDGRYWTKIEISDLR